jgi:translation initiation factor 3 subunit M
MEAELTSFIACSPQEQCQELREYLKNLGAEISTQPSVKGMEDDLHKIIQVCDICFQTGVPEGDIESVLNGIVSVVIIAEPEASDGLVLAFCEKLAKAWEPDNKNGMIALKVLRLLFYSLSEASAMRYHVYYYMVEVAGKVGQIKAIFSTTATLKKQLAARPPTAEQLQKLYRLLHQGLINSKMSDEAYKVMLDLLATYTTENASQAREDAQRCIVASLADPNIYLLDHLLPLKPVKFLEGNPIHDLLTIAVYEGLEEYLKYYSHHKEYLTKMGLDHEKLMKKMRILTLISLAERSSELSFSQIQRELQLEPNQVERFIIDTLKTRLITARIDQASKKLSIQSVVKRALTKAHWIQIRDILTSWKTSIFTLKENMQDIEVTGA